MNAIFQFKQTVQVVHLVSYAAGIGKALLTQKSTWTEREWQEEKQQRSIIEFTTARKVKYYERAKGEGGILSIMSWKFVDSRAFYL